MPVTKMHWPVMVAHAAFDVTAVLMIYWNLEEPIATLFTWPVDSYDEPPLISSRHYQCIGRVLAAAACTSAFVAVSPTSVAVAACLAA